MNKLNRQRWALLIILLAIGAFRIASAQLGLDAVTDSLVLPISQTLQPGMQQDQPVENAELVRAQAEIDRLRSQLKLVENSTQTTTTAEVVRRDVSGQLKTVWLDNSQGEATKNDVVLARGFLFGRVVEADGKLAQVQLLVDPLFRITGQADEQHGIVMTINGSLRFDLVPQQLEAGELIVSDSIDRVFPVGVPIGLVSQGAPSSSDVFDSYYVDLPYNIYDVQFVEVLAHDS